MWKAKKLAFLIKCDRIFVCERGFYMEDINLKDLDDEVLLEVLNTLEGLKDSLNEIEGDLKNE